VRLDRQCGWSGSTARDLPNRTRHCVALWRWDGDAEFWRLAGHVSRTGKTHGLCDLIMTRATQMGGGIQHHHQYNLDGASRDAINMVQWLRGVAEITGAPQHKALLDEALVVSRKIGAAHRVALARLQGLYETDPQRFYRCRKGLEPWPDELAEGFEPICTCEHRCLYHVTKAAASTEADCNCAEVCPRHAIPRQPGDRTPLRSLPPGPGQSGPPSFKAPQNN
jgi:hypothetical protein